MVKFMLVCKICKQPVKEGELLLHVASHDAMNYFDLVPTAEFEKTVKKDKNG